MILYLVIVLFFQESKVPEQIAFDYFTMNILEKEYSISNLYFSGYAEKQNSLNGPFPKCFPMDKELTEFFYKSKPTSADVIKIAPCIRSNLKILKKPKAKTLRVSIYRFVKFGGYDYVHITVYKPIEFLDHYIIKIIDDKVVDFCKVNEVI